MRHRERYDIPHKGSIIYPTVILNPRCVRSVLMKMLRAHMMKLPLTIRRRRAKKAFRLVRAGAVQRIRFRVVDADRVEFPSRELIADVWFCRSRGRVVRGVMNTQVEGNSPLTLTLSPRGEGMCRRPRRRTLRHLRVTRARTVRGRRGAAWVRSSGSGAAGTASHARRCGECGPGSNRSNRR